MLCQAYIFISRTTFGLMKNQHVAITAAAKLDINVMDQRGLTEEITTPLIPLYSKHQGVSHSERCEELQASSGNFVSKWFVQLLNSTIMGVAILNQDL